MIVHFHVTYLKNVAIHMYLEYIRSVRSMW